MWLRVADSVAEFSSVQGQDGWFYGYIRPGDPTPAFTLLPSFSEGHWHQTGFTHWTSIYATHTHPNGDNGGWLAAQEEWAVRRWVSDVEGTFLIEGIFGGGGSGSGFSAARVVVDGDIALSLPRQFNRASTYWSVTVSLSVGSTVDFVHDPAGDDGADLTRFVATIAVTVNVVQGTPGHDTLRGTSGIERLNGLDGNDRLFASDGADTLDGGLGIDTVIFSRAVVLNLGLPAASTGEARGDAYISIERFSGSAAADTLIGSAGHDHFSGAAGNDLLQGADGNDTLQGGAGADTLVAGGGNDDMIGGAGSDRFVIADSAGRKRLWGGELAAPVGDGAADVVVLRGRPDEWRFTYGEADLLLSRRASGQSVVLQDVELGLFDALRANVVRPASFAQEMVRLAHNAYGDSASAAFEGTTAATSRGWAPLQGLEIGLAPSGTTASGLGWTMRDGIYRAADGSAVAHLLFGVVQGKTTVSLSFRGTDDPLSDGADYRDFGRHFAKFEPLLDALVRYVESGGFVAGGRIDQVWVSGHSLGGAMAQMFMQDVGLGDTRYLGATFGSPGAATHAPDPRIIHYEHTYDLVPFAGDIARRTDLVDSLASALGLVAPPLGAALLGLSGALGGDAGIAARDYALAGGIVRLGWPADVNVLLAHAPMSHYVRSIDGLATLRPEFGVAPDYLSPRDLPPGEVVHVGVGARLEGAPLALAALRGGRGADGSESQFGTAGEDHLSGQSGADTLRGGRGSDSLLGGDGDDMIIGGPGGDLFQGGAGRDRLITTADGARDEFRYAAAAEGGDRITGFVSGEDVIALSRQGFGIGAHRNAADLFVGGGAPTPAGSNFAVLYNRATGLLQADTNGAASGGLVLLASVGAGVSLAASDIVLIA